jgi:hypothetical protein
MRVMHRLTVKLCTVLRGPLAARRYGTVIALAVIEMMIDVPIEMLRPMEPRTGADEDTTREPFRAVIAVWSAIVRRNLVIPVRANWRFSDADCNLCIRCMRSGEEKARNCNSQVGEVSHCFHRFTFLF